MSDNIQSIDLSKLILDSENPRLPESLDRDQISMINYIAESTSIEELMDVIAQNGYFIGEPVVAVPEKDNSGADTGLFVVVEGNRRLTALKLLQDSHIATTSGSRIHEIAENSDSIKPTIIPVVVRNTRLEILPYLGFRHITGIKQWEPLAKARYMEQILATTDINLPIRDRWSKVAKIIGSQRTHIKRSLEALEVYRVIKNNDYFEIEGLSEEKIKFAVLSTAIADERIAKFIGAEQDDVSNTDTRTLNSRNIKELTRWLYEKDSKKGKTRVGESRNLKYLGAVVESPKALAAFKGGALLKVAYMQTHAVTLDFIELLYSADSALVEASSMVGTLDYDEDSFMVVRRIIDNIKLISRELKSKQSPDDSDDF
jgi:hypothetical protein